MIEVSADPMQATSNWFFLARCAPERPLGLPGAAIEQAPALTDPSALGAEKR